MILLALVVLWSSVFLIGIVHIADNEINISVSGFYAIPLIDS